MALPEVLGTDYRKRELARALPESPAVVLLRSAVAEFFRRCIRAAPRETPGNPGAGGDDRKTKKRRERMFDEMLKVPGEFGILVARMSDCSKRGGDRDEDEQGATEGFHWGKFSSLRANGRKSDC